jgi:hypothetical protein
MVKIAEVNGWRSGARRLAFPTFRLRNAEKSRKSREKCMSKILVYGSEVARVNRKPKPGVAAAAFATAFELPLGA